MTEGNLQLQDMDNGNRRAAAENSELLRKLEEVDGNIGTLNKAKISLTNQGRGWRIVCARLAKKVVKDCVSRGLNHAAYDPIF